MKVLGIDLFHNVVQVDLYPERPPTKTVNALLPQLRHLTRLRSLALSDGEFHDEDIKSLVGLNDLEYVWLDSKQITDASVETIAELSSLRRISVELSANGKFRLRQLRPNLYVY